MGYPVRPDWSALAAGAVVWPVVLVAGVPALFVMPGCPLTKIKWTGTFADTAFWPALTGASTTDVSAYVKPWLQVSKGFRTGYTSHGPDGTVDVAVPDVVLYDNGGPNSPTALFASVNAYPTSTLTATLEADGTSMTVAASAVFGISGAQVVLYVGNEAIGGTIGSDGHTIASLTRGLYGSLPTVHVAQTGNAISRVYGAIPSLGGRTASLFYVQQDTNTGDSGYLATGVDPEMRFYGSVKPGNGADGATFKLSLAPWVRKPEDRSDTSLGSYSVSGIVHYFPYGARGASINYPDDSGPLSAYWNGVAMCLTTGPSTGTVGDGTYDNGGWSQNATDFFQRWNRAAAALTIPDGGAIWAVQHADGTANVNASTGSADSPLLVASLLYGSTFIPDETDNIANASWRSPQAFPDTLQRLDVALYIVAADAAQIPSLSVGQWCLSATINDVVQTCLITSVVARGSYSVVGMQAPPQSTTVLAGLNTSVSTTPEAAYLITQACQVTLGAWMTNATWWGGLQALATQLNSLPGSSVLADAYDWQDIAAQGLAAASTSPFGVQRNGPVDISKPFIGLFSNEVRLAGGVVVVRRGRISWRTFAAVTTLSPVVAALGKASARKGKIPTITDSRDRVVAKYAATDVAGNVYTVVDGNAAVQAGGSYTAWEANIPAGAIVQPFASGFVQGLQSFALGAIAPWRTSYQLMTFYGSPALLDTTVGDTVYIPDDWIAPNGLGSRGFTGVGQIIASEERMFGGDTGVDLTIKLAQSAFTTPYAPEVLLSAANATTGVLTVDILTFGQDGFGLPGSGQGGADSFHVGDLVQLMQIGVASPATPYACTITAVDLLVSPPTITVSPAPNSTWAGYVTAGAPESVILTYQDYGSDTNTWPTVPPQPAGSQVQYAFVGSASSGLIVSGVYPDRWA